MRISSTHRWVVDLSECLNDCPGTRVERDFVRFSEFPPSHPADRPHRRKDATFGVESCSRAGASFNDNLRSSIRRATEAAIQRALRQIEPEQQLIAHKRNRSPSMHKTIYKGHKAKRTKTIIYNFKEAHTSFNSIIIINRHGGRGIRVE